MPFCCTDALASVSPVQLFFTDFLLNWLVVDSFFELLFFQMFSWLFELSWPEFERVCKVSRANSIWIELLTQESLLIVRSRTKNYKTLTKSLIGDHVDGEPAGPRRRRRRAHRTRRGSRAPLLGGGRQPRAAGTGQLCPLQFAFPLLVLATDSSCELVVPIRLNWSCPEWAPTLTTK